MAQSQSVQTDVGELVTLTYLLLAFVGMLGVITTTFAMDWTDPLVQGAIAVGWLAVAGLGAWGAIEREVEK